MTTRCDDLKANVKRTFSEVQHQMLTENQVKITTNKHMITETEILEALLTSVTNHGTNEQKYISTRVVIEQTAKYKSVIETQCGTLYKLKPSITYSDELNNFLKSGKSLATFHMNKDLLSTEQREEEMRADRKLVRTVDLNKEEDYTDEPMYSGMALLPDDRLAVIDNKNEFLSIRDNQHLKKLGKYGTYKFTDHRFDVTVVSEEDVAVTSGGNLVIEFLQVSKSNHITLTRSITTTVPYFSICLMNDTTFLVSTYENTRHLRMITLTGKESDFENLPQKEYKVGDSICMRNKDKLILTDRDDHTLYMYNNERNIRTLTRDEHHVNVD